MPGVVTSVSAGLLHALPMGSVTRPGRRVRTLTTGPNWESLANTVGGCATMGRTVTTSARPVGYTKHQLDVLHALVGRFSTCSRVWSRNSWVGIQDGQLAISMAHMAHGRL